ncbi:phytanoyl- dioxygenase family [Fusarium albosuccineum]|uniref:Phytanoyl- dioxygenase family n=1 Tax=Fusarium albosuccineum TaxID=1237068 RepID=A0A8H4L1H6_9HYPO|nr:phytanoyl- dioxygenase family [Fusarium albosuccineum]
MSYQPDEAPNNTIINNQVGSDKKLFRKQVDPNTQELINTVIKQGYVILENVFTHDEVDEATQELRRLASEHDTAGPASVGGRNKFEGFRTRRISSLLNKSRVFDKFATNPEVMALNDYFLDPGWLLSLFQSICIQPGEDPQALHHDDGYVTLPRPHRPFGTAIMVSLDAYTETNGSTVVVPGSHEWGPDCVPNRSEAIPIIMPKGSIVYFLGTLWHGGGQNISNNERRALTVQFCQP